MPSISGIQVRSGKKAAIQGESEDLRVYASPINSDNITSRIGEEKIVKDQEIIDLAEGHFRAIHTIGQRFKLIAGTVQGGRTLLAEVDRPEQIVAALNWTRVKKETFISNIYVDPALRRRGLASALVEIARKEHSRLCVDSNFTVSGAALFGQIQIKSTSLKP